MPLRLISAFMAQMSGALLLALVFYYLYRQHRERYINLWAWSFASYALWVVMELLVRVKDGPEGPGGAEVAAKGVLLLSGLLLLWGTVEFLGHRLPRKWFWGCVVFGIVNFVWMWGVIMLGRPLALFHTPTYLFLGGIYAVTGLALLRSKTIAGPGKWVAGWAFLFWATCHASYPFLPVGRHSWPLYELPLAVAVTMISVCATVGILLAYFQTARLALMAGEKRFRLLAENALDAIFLYRYDPTPWFEYVSPSAEKLLGYTPDEFYADPNLALRMVFADDRRLVRFLQERVEMPDKPLVARCLRKDGVMVWCECRYASILNAEGKVIAVEGIVRDVTAQRETEAALMRSERRLLRVVESVAEMIVLLRVTDGGLEVEIVNAAFREQTGLSQAQAAGKQLSEIFLPEEVAPLVARIEQAQWIRKTVQYSHPMKLKKEERFLETTITPIFNVTGECTHVLAVSADITERQRAEEALRQSETLLRNLFETAAIGLAVVDLEGRFQTTNAALQKMLGRSEPELRKWTLADATYADDADRDAVLYREMLAGQRDHYQAQKRYVRKDGKIIWGRATISLVRNEEDNPQYVIVMIENLTRRRRAEAARRATEDRFRWLVQMSGSAILCLSGDHRVMEISREAARVFGWDREQVLGKDYFDFSLRNSQCVAVAAEIQRVLQGREPRIFETVWESVEGDERTFMWNVSRLTSPRGKHAGMIVIGQDITARKVAEEALRASETKYRELVQNANSIIMRRRVDGTITFFNEYAQTFFGYDENEILGKHVVGTIVPETDSSGADLAEMIETIGRYPEQFASNVNENMRRNGERVWVAWSNRAIQNEAGMVAEILCVGTDVTWRKQAEEALRDNEERYRLLFNSGTDAVFVYAAGDGNTPGKFVEVNDIACRRLGYSRRELLALSPQEVMAPEGRGMFLELHEHLSVEGNVLAEMSHQTKAGDSFPVEVNAHRFELGGQPSVLLVSRDVTERKRLERQLLQSQKMEAIGRLAGGVAHDFNNLLTVMMGYSELLVARMTDEKLRKNVEEIQKAGERAVTLTRQLLTFSRRQVLVPRILNLNTVVADLEPMLQRLIGEHIELVMELAEGTVNVTADAAQLEQVIMNLVVNARDAMPSGGVVIIETALVGTDQAPESAEDGCGAAYVLLTVSDTGCGMDAGVKERLFEPFFTTKEQDQGTGLGLSMVYGIVTQSGGRITVESELDEGTTFKIFLPLAEGTAREAAEVETEVRGRIGGTETILVIEDEAMVRNFVSSILRMRGYRVLVAQEGYEATRMAEGYDETIHLILSDVIMPHMNGVEAVKRVTKLHPESRVLYMSGYTDGTIGEQFEAIRRAGFIQKPFSERNLHAKIREVLAGGSPAAGAAKRGENE